jgi:O-methyltransferase involved in polyketide biosynthesis
MENQNTRPIDLRGVQETLLIPLWARAKESQKANPVLIDRRAVSILDALRFDCSKMDKALPEYYQLTWAVRAKMLDEEIKAFLVQHPAATVVNLGAGLDTSFERIDNGAVRWYDLDLPDVIELRKRLIPETERSKYIPQSIFDPEWSKAIGNPTDGLLFVACGVLPYFREKEVKQLLTSLATGFPAAEIVFDIGSRFFIWAGKWLLRWRTGMNIQSYMKWGVDSAQVIARWDKRFQVLEEYPFFSKIKMDASWSKDTVYAMRRADRMRGFNIVHLRFLPS